MAENVDTELGRRASEQTQQVGTGMQRLDMNGTTNVTITLRQGTYRVRLNHADPTVFAYGSFGGAPTLPATGAAMTDDLQYFPSQQMPETLYVGSDATYNVKLSSAGTPILIFQWII